MRLCTIHSILILLFSALCAPVCSSPDKLSGHGQRAALSSFLLIEHGFHPSLSCEPPPHWCASDVSMSMTQLVENSTVSERTFNATSTPPFTCQGSDEGPHSLPHAQTLSRQCAPFHACEMCRTLLHLGKALHLVPQTCM